MMHYTFAAFLMVAISGCSFSQDRTVVAAIPIRQEAYVLPSKPPVRNKPIAVAERASSLVQTAYLGRAPYICTPSGFGSTSRCFLR